MYRKDYEGKQIFPVRERSVFGLRLTVVRNVWAPEAVSALHATQAGMDTY